MSGASHSKHSKSGQSRVRSRFSRRVGFKSPLPVVVVVCDDNATAPAYFAPLQREIKASVILNVVPAPYHGASPNDVVKEAIEQRSKLKNGEEKGDAVWAIFDTEHEPHDRLRAKAAKEKAKQKKIKVAVSDPCYEVWTLLHLEDTGRHFANCQAVINQIKTAWKKKFDQPFGPQKAQADYRKIVSLRHKASKRAKKHCQSSAQSTTEVYKLIDHIESLVKNQNA